MRWINLGVCDTVGCHEKSEWFTIKDDDVDMQFCNNHFPPEAKE